MRIHANFLEDMGKQLTEGPSDADQVVSSNRRNLVVKMNGNGNLLETFGNFWKVHFSLVKQT